MAWANASVLLTVKLRPIPQRIARIHWSSRLISSRNVKYDIFFRPSETFFSHCGTEHNSLSAFCSRDN